MVSSWIADDYFLYECRKGDELLLLLAWERRGVSRRSRRPARVAAYHCGALPTRAGLRRSAIGRVGRHGAGDRCMNRSAAAAASQQCALKYIWSRTSSNRLLHRLKRHRARQTRALTCRGLWFISGENRRWMQGAHVYKEHRLAKGKFHVRIDTAMSPDMTRTWRWH
jgi:hypothetical protein